MLAENKVKFNSFQSAFRTLDSSWRQERISFKGNDKMFTAMYEPEYPMSSNSNRILIYSLTNKNYMLFLQSGSGCVVNTKDIGEVKQYLADMKLNNFRTEG